MSDIVLSLMMLSAAALLAGALYLWRVRGNTKQSTLMAVLAVVMLANVAIWLIPNERGDALADAASPDG